MSPEDKKLLQSCLQNGNSELACEALMNREGKEGVAFLKGFINREKNKRYPLKRQHLITDAEFRLQALESKLKAEKEAAKPAKKSARPAPAKRVKVEVVADNAAMDLAAVKAGIEKEQGIIEQHFSAAREATLPHMLRLGLWCLKARHLLAMSPVERARAGGQAKAALSESDKAEGEEITEPASFSAWIAAEVEGVSRPNAYNYLHAAEGLGMTPDSTEAELDAALEKARKEAGEKLSIAKLAHKRPKPEEDEEEQEDPNSPEAKAAEARLFVRDWVGRWDKGLKAGNLEDLDAEGLREMEEFLRNTLDRIKRRLKSAK